MGTAVAQWLRCCATSRKVAGSIPAGVSGFFIDIKSFRSHYGPGDDSASNRNEYQEYFLRVKTAGAVVMTSGNRNFPEPSGPLQACNGTALPLHKTQLTTAGKTGCTGRYYYGLISKIQVEKFYYSYFLLLSRTEH